MYIEDEKIAKFWDMVEHFSKTSVTPEEKMIQFEVIAEKYVEMLISFGVCVEVTKDFVVKVGSGVKMLDTIHIESLESFKKYLTTLQTYAKTFVNNFGYVVDKNTGKFHSIIRCYDVLYIEDVVTGQ